MVDVVDGATRSRMMAGIKGKNTQPELTIRRFLHGNGLRYRLHRKDLPGKPDLVLTRHNLVVFVHGCFWHRHPECFYATSPATRKAFWQEKLQKNVERDQRQIALLREDGWRVLVIWECGIRHCREQLSEVLECVHNNEPEQQWPTVPPRQR
ncbi:very short patch repair endonuclease [Larsenimonas rhizosphaerae]|uniref:Very short patch repair endonuclease n=1 Tax=Larsenimonas rhizosphaerae TaxID=2944682 RepID=A0AA42CV06_9GAMM|nr:DNA mismatch endonuclease Vsr [Larsenimonas rhizosphaerae]MCM2131484.1 DNA mismatch endonuclease Vsr [Larsenimonas rhizosphaerae]MCX2525202.1 DNA mismatch endonuclease Vsr [Larsenimonas rhizosphaerae]